jgi:hypothetical protein
MDKERSKSSNYTSLISNKNHLMIVSDIDPKQQCSTLVPTEKLWLSPLQTPSIGVRRRCIPWFSRTSSKRTCGVVGTLGLRGEDLVYFLPVVVDVVEMSNGRTGKLDTGIGWTKIYVRPRIISAWSRSVLCTSWDTPSDSTMRPGNTVSLAREPSSEDIGLLHAYMHE